MSKKIAFMCGSIDNKNAKKVLSVCDVCVYVSGSGSGSFIRSKYLRVVFEVNFFAYVGGFLITYNNIKIGKIRHTTRCV